MHGSNESNHHFGVLANKGVRHGFEGESNQQWVLNDILIQQPKTVLDSNDVLLETVLRILFLPLVRAVVTRVVIGFDRWDTSV